MNSLEGEFLESMQGKDEKKVLKLLKMGFPVNRHIKKTGASLGSHTYPLIMAIDMQLIQVCYSLLNSGANVNNFDSIGITPILSAARVGDLTIIKLLIQNHADISARDFFGNTILHIAGTNSHIPVLKYCINDLKIPAIVKNRKGQTALAACIEIQETAKNLNTIEKIQESIEYLWKAEEEFKKNRLKDNITKNSYVKKHPRFNLSDLAPVSIIAEEKKFVIPGGKNKASIQSYLKAKHLEIFRNEHSFTYRAPKISSGLRSSSVKPLTN